MKCFRLFILCLGLTTATASGQSLPESTQNRNPIYVGIGAFARSGSYQSIAPFSVDLTNYLKNTSGFGGNAGVQYGFYRAGILAEYSLDVRYDHVFNKLDERLQPIGEIKGMLYTHNLMAYKTLGNRSELSRRYYLGAGISIVNAGRKQTYYDPVDGEQTYNLQYTALNLTGGIPLWKLTLEPRIQYVPKKEFPYNRNSSQTILMLRVYYRFKLR